MLISRRKHIRIFTPFLMEGCALRIFPAAPRWHDPQQMIAGNRLHMIIGCWQTNAVIWVERFICSTPTPLNYLGVMSRALFKWVTVLLHHPLLYESPSYAVSPQAICLRWGPRVALQRVVSRLFNKFATSLSHCSSTQGGAANYASQIYECRRRERITRETPLEVFSSPVLLAQARANKYRTSSSYWS